MKLIYILKIYMINMKLIKFFILIFFSYLIFFTNYSYSSNLSIAGLSKLTKSDLSTITSIDINKEYFNSSEINQIINDLYSSDLIYKIEYELIDNTHSIRIIESKIIENIFINGNIKIKEDVLLQNISSTTNFLFNKNDILDDINKIKNIYSSIGYNETNVNVQIENFAEDRVNLIFQVSEGNQSELINIEFFGNESYSNNFLSSLINSKANHFYNIFSSGSNFDESIFNFDVNKLINFYKRKGFFDINISYNLYAYSQSKYSLKFYIDEGSRYTIKGFFYEKNEINNLPNYLEDNFQKELEKNDFYYDSELIVDHLKKLNLQLSNSGSSTSNFTYKFDVLDSNQIDLLFYQENLDPKYINRIFISGNTITKDKTIRNKLNFEPGDLYNSSIFNSSKNKLSQLRYINSVEINEYDITPQKTDIEIILNENKKTGTFLVGGSISGDVGLGAGITLKDFNLFGTGNEIDSSIQVNSEQALFKIDYTSSPSINPSISNTYSVFNEDNDLTNSFGYKTKKLGFGFSTNFKIKEKLSFSSGLIYEDVEGYAAKNISNFITDNIGQFQNILFKFSLTRNNTNDFLYPSDGSYNRLNIVYSPSEISDDSFYKIIYNNDLYFKRKDKDGFFFFDNNLGVAKSLNGKLKTINSFSLGGLNFKGFDYRGVGPYDNNIYLGGNNYFASTLGYGSSFLFDQKDNINLKLFYSIGSIWNSDYVSDNDLEIRSSAGISFDVLTAIGPLSFSYAVPIDSTLNDKKRSFNFSIGSSF